MTQVWMVRNSDTDIHLFNRFEHLKPSVEISFCRCQEVKIEVEHQPILDGDVPLLPTVKFHVTGKRDGVEFKATIAAQRWPVWTEPGHL